MSNTLFVGIDVAKSFLQIALQNSNFSLPNTTKGIGDLIKKLKLLQPSHPIQIILESTGGYELLVMTLLQSAQFKVSRVNPKQMRDFARASSILAKTDKIDAKVIKLFGEKMQPIPSAAITKTQLVLNERVQRREQLLSMINSEKNRMEHSSDKKVLSSIKSLIKVLSSQLKENQKTIDELIKENEEFSKRFNLLTKIEGVGSITAALLIAKMPELGFLKRGSAASLLGLAPFNQDSGSSVKGYRSIRGGRGALRKALYMPAITAKKLQPSLRAFYDRLLKVGKKPKVALIAVMRKLIELCNSVLKCHLPIPT